jgi:hypothetical protein
MQQVERERVTGGWVVSRVQQEEGGPSISFTFFPEPELEQDDDGPWPSDPSISSTTSRVQRRPRS